MPINKEGPEAVRAAAFALPPAVHPAGSRDGTSPRRQPRPLPAPSPGTDAGSGRMGACSILTMQVFLGRNHWDGIIPLPGWKHNPGQMAFLRYSPSQGRRERDRNYRRERARNYRSPYVTTRGSVTVTTGGRA